MAFFLRSALFSFRVRPVLGCGSCRSLGALFFFRLCHRLWFFNFLFSCSCLSCCPAWEASGGSLGASWGSGLGGGPLVALIVWAGAVTAGWAFGDPQSPRGSPLGASHHPALPLPPSLLLELLLHEPSRWSLFHLCLIGRGAKPHHLAQFPISAKIVAALVNTPGDGRRGRVDKPGQELPRQLLQIQTAWRVPNPPASRQHWGVIKDDKRGEISCKPPIGSGPVGATTYTPFLANPATAARCVLEKNRGKKQTLTE